MKILRTAQKHFEKGRHRHIKCPGLSGSIAIRGELVGRISKVRAAGVALAIFTSAILGDSYNINEMLRRRAYSRQHCAEISLERNIAELKESIERYRPQAEDYKDDIISLGLACPGETSARTKQDLCAIAAQCFSGNPLAYDKEIKAAMKSLMDKQDYEGVKEMFALNPQDYRDRLLEDHAEESLKRYTQMCKESAKKAWISLMGYMSVRYFGGKR